MNSSSRTHLRSGEMLPMSAPSVQPSVGGLMTRWKRGEDRKVRHRCQRGRGGMQDAEGEPTSAEGSFLSSPSFELPATTLHACPMRTSERRSARGRAENVRLKDEYVKAVPVSLTRSRMSRRAATRRGARS